MVRTFSHVVSNILFCLIGSEFHDFFEQVELLKQFTSEVHFRKIIQRITTDWFIRITIFTHKAGRILHWVTIVQFEILRCFFLIAQSNSSPLLGKSQGSFMWNLSGLSRSGCLPSVSTYFSLVSYRRSYPPGCDLILDFGTHWAALSVNSWLNSQGIIPGSSQWQWTILDVEEWAWID